MKNKKKAIAALGTLVPVEVIQSKIFLIRGRKVMLDKDLAQLYGVSTGRLNEQVKRNTRRFPDDFMLRLKRNEFYSLISHFATSNRGGRRKLPHAFTEQGVAMLSSVLNSERAIEVNIQIMRVFVKLKELMISHKDLARKIEALEHKFKDYDNKFVLVFEAIKQLLAPSQSSKPKIGFHGG